MSAIRRTLESILIENGIISGEQLKQVINYARAVGIDLHEAVLQKKIASPEFVMMAYAESIGFPFIHLADFSIDEEVVVQVDPITARQYSFVPISIDQGQVLLATTKPVVPDIEEELRMIFNLPVRCVICIPSELNAAVAKYYPREASRIIKDERRKKMPLHVAAAKETEHAEPLTSEEEKDRLLKTIVAFNFSFAFVCFTLFYLQIPRGIHNTWYQFPLLALFGIIAGGVAAFITWKKLSR